MNVKVCGEYVVWGRGGGLMLVREGGRVRLIVMYKVIYAE